MLTKFMGETSAKLRQIFDLMIKEHGVYLFDEFDAIGGSRSLDNDVGEMRRVLNSFLQFIEQDTSDSILIAATNYPNLLDTALFRRFDDILMYQYPNDKTIRQLIENTLGTFKLTQMKWSEILEKSDGLSQAEIVMACRDSIKKTILEDKSKISTAALCSFLEKRRDSNSILRGEE
jgi:SpoVK/Ycf46/Vps4 family AAA+-type ATPase